MTIFDILTLALIILLTVIGYRRGLLRSVFGLISFAVSYLLAWRLYPHMSSLLRDAGLYGWLQQSVAGFMNLDRAAEVPPAMQAGVLAQLPLPEFLTGAITAGNNPEAYLALGVSTLGGYISGYFANAVLNLISMILVFAVAFALMRLVSGALGFVSKIPVIGVFNRLGGLALGLAEGIVLVWVAMAVLTLVVLRPGYEGVFEQVRGGPVAGFFYANNPVAQAMARIRPPTF